MPTSPLAQALLKKAQDKAISKDGHVLGFNPKGPVGGINDALVQRDWSNPWTGVQVMKEVRDDAKQFNDDLGALFAYPVERRAKQAGNWGAQKLGFEKPFDVKEGAPTDDEKGYLWGDYLTPGEKLESAAMMGGMMVPVVGDAYAWHTDGEFFDEPGTRTAGNALISGLSYIPYLGASVSQIRGARRMVEASRAKNMAKALEARSGASYEGKAWTDMSPRKRSKAKQQHINYLKKERGMTDSDVAILDKWVGGDGSIRPEDMPMVEGAIAKLPDYKGSVVRDHPGDVSSMIPGEEFSFGRPVSSTKYARENKNAAQNATIIIETKNGKDISKFATDKFAGEYEVIIPGTSKFKVLDNGTDPETGHQVVRLKEI